MLYQNHMIINIELTCSNPSSLPHDIKMDKTIMTNIFMS